MNEPLTTSQFLPLLQKLPLVFKQYKGTFAPNALPATLEPDTYIIVNRTSGIGSHWFAVLRNNEVIEVFDSLKATRSQLQNLVRFKLDIVTNSDVVQGASLTTPTICANN